MKQTILGSGGAIGLPLAKELKKYTDEIRLVSRNPKKVNNTDELYPLDVNNLGGVSEAIKGSSIVYITIGFEYNLNVWKEKWPAFMKSVIDACQEHDAKLVFFDNVYMYASSAIPHMTEESPMQPPSKKGAVRKEIYEMVASAVDQKKLTALVARAADFYGPDNKNGVHAQMVVKNFLTGKKAQSIGNQNAVHNFTYTLDAAKATAQLGNTPDAYDQVWHLPTTQKRLTNLEWIALFAKEFGVKCRVQQVPTWMMRLLGLFIPMMSEFPEMMYQYELDYFFDSSKFEKRFGWSAISPEEGVKVMVEHARLLNHKNT